MTQQLVTKRKSGQRLYHPLASGGFDQITPPVKRVQTTYPLRFSRDRFLTPNYRNIVRLKQILNKND